MKTSQTIDRRLDPEQIRFVGFERFQSCLHSAVTLIDGLRDYSR